jgi:hypothetical protein
VTSESSIVSQQVSDMGVSLYSADGPIFLNPTLETLRGETQAQNWKKETRRLIEEVESSKKYGGNAAIDSDGDEETQESRNEDSTIVDDEGDDENATTNFGQNVDDEAETFIDDTSLDTMALQVDGVFRMRSK